MIRKFAEDIAYSSSVSPTLLLLARHKLAQELGTNDIVTGENETAPLDPPDAPEGKPDMGFAPDYGFTDTTTHKHDETMHGTLDRTLDGYAGATRDYNDSMSRILGEHVRSTSGSPAVTQRAVRRFRDRNKS